MGLKIKANGNEPAENVWRKFKKLCDKEGIARDIKRQEYFETRSQVKRRKARKAIRRLERQKEQEKNQNSNQPTKRTYKTRGRSPMF